ncbi:MAG TPA: SPASM domain-containing protein [Chlorobaculum sp.]|nr:radical SAM/SPASM domain-containing protein [Chlorobiaceae bacterium]HWQ26864.1 SPASM domain-containing protein [Chlorobaculum sp.]
MELTLDQAVQFMGRLFQQREFATLARMAEELTQQNPRIAIAWRYMGIAKIFTEGIGEQHLHQAALLDDEEANLWLSVLSECACYPKGKLVVDDIIAQVGFTRLRRSPYMDYPTEVTIETQAVCNARCSFCPYDTMKRKGERMSDALIDKIIDDLKAIPKDLSFTIAPFKVNEPFLDKRFITVCEKINKELHNAQLRIFTNGSTLTDDVIDRVSGVRNVIHLWVSLNESEKASYEAKIKLPFDKTIAKLDALHKRADGGDFHQVIVSRVADGSDADGKFRLFLKERYPLFDCVLLGREDWTGQVSSEEQRRVSSYGCYRWFEVSIMASGKVALCCMDGEGKHVIGDVNNQSVLDIYNSPRYKKLRQYTNSRIAAVPPCDQCTYCL